MIEVKDYDNKNIAELEANIEYLLVGQFMNNLSGDLADIKKAHNQMQMFYEYCPKVRKFAIAFFNSNIKGGNFFFHNVFEYHNVLKDNSNIFLNNLIDSEVFFKNSYSVLEHIKNVRLGMAFNDLQKISKKRNKDYYSTLRKFISYLGC